MDPRVRLQGVSADLLGQLTASLSEHVKWLEGQLEEAGSRRRAGYSHSQSQDKATPWQNLLKSPARQRIATDKTNVTRTGGAFNHLSSTSVAPPSSNIFGCTRAIPPQNKQQAGASTSLFRSPGKVGLNAAAKSPIQQQQYNEDSDKENSLAKSTRSTTSSSNTASSKPKPGSGSSSLNASRGSGPSTSLRSPGGRSVLGASTSRQQQQQPQSPAASTRSQQVASPTPRPPSRIAKSPLNNQTKNAKPAAAVSETPVKVVDDVFMLGSEGLQDLQAEGEQNEDEDEDDDDDEVADILLGYAKTPAQASKSSHINTATSAKGLPAIPVTLSALHTSPPGRSPPRPAKSPARPSPTHTQAQPVLITMAASPIASKVPGSPITSKVPGAVTALSAMHSARVPASPRPAPRNMSDLASIASVLGSPMKASSIPSQNQQPIATSPQIPANVIQAARAIVNRPTSPVPGTASPSRVPIPSTSSHLKSPSQATSVSTTTTAPRVRSPLMSDKISYFQSVSQKDLTKPLSPPTRASSRLAGMASPPGSPRIGSPVPSSFTGNRQLVPPSSPRLAGGNGSMMPKSPRMQQVRQMAQQVEEKTKPESAPGAAVPESKQIEEIPRPTSPAPVSAAIRSPRRPQLSPVQSTLATSPARHALTSPVQEKGTETFKSSADRKKAPIPTPTPPPKSPLRAQLAEAAKQAIEAAVTLEKGEKEGEEKAEEPSVASPAVKAKDFAGVEPVSEVLPADPTEGKAAEGAEKEVQHPMEVEVPIKEAPTSTSSATRPHQLGQNTSSGTAIPPSPVFSSFLSNPNRTSALSFVGLPGRFLGSGHTREKSLGLGLGLGKSLSAANAARLGKEVQQQQQDSDSQGSSNNGQSFHSALSGGKKRLSSALMDQIESQGSTASSSSKVARTESITTASSSRASVVTQSQAAAPTSKEDATKAKLDMLRSRISNFKGVAGTNGARVSSISSIQSYNAAIPAQNMQPSAVSVQSRSSVFGNEQTGLFSPPPTVSATSNTQAEETTLPQETPATAPAHSAALTFSSAIASLVPAPSFSASFANLFGASLSKPLPPMSSPPKEKDLALPKPAAVGIYPSLPSMTNLAALSSPIKEKRASVEPGDEDMEELAEPQKWPEQKESRSRRPSACSSHDIVETFEAKTAAAKVEKERQDTTSPVQRRISNNTNVPQAAPPTPKPAVSTLPVFRSTTPPFSPPAMQATRAASIASTRASLSSLGAGGRLSIDPGHTDELAIEDPDVEPIARASSVGTEAAETEADEQMEEDVGINVSDMDTPPRVLSSQQSQPVEADLARVSAPARQQTEETQAQEQAPSRAFKPSHTASTLAKSTNASTFKPTRPVIEVIEPAKTSKSTIARPLSRAPSVSSLAPSRASTISVASTASYNPNKSTNGSSLNKKTGLGSSMSGKPEVKSLQMAAAVAKKEQAEKDRKAALKNERDQKRASVIVTKKDDMADGEKKRKERDEQSQRQSQTQGYSQSSQGSSLATAKGKAPMVKPKMASTSSKADDEPAKKRKMDVEVVVTKTAVKKMTVVRPAQPKASTSNNLASSSNRPPAPSSSQPTAHSKALAASASMIGVVKQASSSQPSRPLQASTSRAPLQPAKTVAQQALLSQHQQAMSALGKSQVSRPAPQASSKPLPPVEPEPEPFELPEVDSEYSDSDEEEQAKKAAARPDWTQSPALRQALSMQATFDPDDLFGEIPTLRMEEMFQHKSTAARLRFRTSSAHWSGPDALSKYEEQEYARRMGFTSNQR